MAQRLLRLHPLLDDYDYILAEPPSLGLLTITLLTASANGVIIPCSANILPRGPEPLLRTIQQVRDVLNERLRHCRRGADHVRQPHQLGATGRRKCANTSRRHQRSSRNVRLSEAPSHGQTILSYAPASRASPTRP